MYRMRIPETNLHKQSNMFYRKQAHPVRKGKSFLFSKFAMKLMSTCKRMKLNTDPILYIKND